MTKSKRVTVPVQGRGDVGFVSDRTHGYLDLLVDADGTVRRWDDVAGHYTLAHDLTDEQRSEAHRLAGLAM